jgi:hypothetical protein
MNSNREGSANARARRWGALAAKGKARWVVVRGVLGFGVAMTVFTFAWEHISDHPRLGFLQALKDLSVRVPLCLVGGYLFGLLTWKWFSLRYGPKT